MKIERRHYNFGGLAERLLSLVMLLLLVGCGGQCYIDPDFSNCKTKPCKSCTTQTANFTVVPGVPLNTGLIFSTSKEDSASNPGSFYRNIQSLTVSGTVNLCANKNSPSQSSIVTICQDQQLYLCSGSTSGTYTNCLNNSGAPNGTLLGNATCVQENDVCDNGVLWRENVIKLVNNLSAGIGTWSKMTNSCQTAACTHGTLTLSYFTNIAPSGVTCSVPSITLPDPPCMQLSAPNPLSQPQYMVATSTACPAGNVQPTYPINANTSTWTTDILDSNGLRAGNIIELTVDAPVSASGSLSGNGFPQLGSISASPPSPSPPAFPALSAVDNMYASKYAYEDLVNDCYSDAPDKIRCLQTRCQAMLGPILCASIKEVAAQPLSWFTLSHACKNLQPSLPGDLCDIVFFGGYPRTPSPLPATSPYPKFAAWNTSLDNTKAQKFLSCQQVEDNRGTEASSYVWHRLGCGLMLNFNKACSFTGSCANTDGGFPPECRDSDVIDFTNTSGQDGISKAYGPQFATQSLVPANPNDPSHAAQVVGSAQRKFVAQQPLPDLCARIAAPELSAYDNMIGGYNMKVSVQSCVAVSGSPSCDTSEPTTYGALTYGFGSASALTAVSNGSGCQFYQLPTISDSGGGPTTDPNKPQTYSNIQNNTGSDGALYLGIALPTGQTTPQVPGAYSVAVNYEECSTKALISGLINDIKTFVTNIVFNPDPSKVGSFNNYFKKLQGETSYSSYIRILLTLYIILYAAGFLTGHIQVSSKDLLIRIIKFGVVIALISDNSWNFFNTYFFSLFINGADSILALISDCSPDAAFCFVDDTLWLLILNPYTWLKFLALIGVNPLGIIIVIMLLLAVFYFLLGVFAAIVSYLLCILAIGVLIALAPIFIPFCLFSFTRKMFDSWWQMLARYALEPIILVLGLQILVSIFYAALVQVLDFTVCWKCMWSINVGGISVIKTVLDALSMPTTLFCLPFFGPFGVFPGGGGILFSTLTSVVPNALIITIMGFLIRDYSAFVHTVVNGALEGSMPSPSLGKNAKGEEYADTSEMLRSKLGVTSKEQAVSKWGGGKLRAGIKSLTGLEVRTDDDNKQEEERLKRRGAALISNKTTDHQILGSALGAAGSNNQEAVSNLKGSDRAKANAAASTLGSAMFGAISKGDELTHKTFTAGLQKLASTDKQDLEKTFGKQSAGVRKNLENLQAVLQTDAVLGSLDDLASKNAGMKHAAESSVGHALYKDRATADILLNQERDDASGPKPNREAISAIIGLGRKELG